MRLIGEVKSTLICRIGRIVSWSFVFMFSLKNETQMSERLPTALCTIPFTIIQSAIGISNSPEQTYFKVLAYIQMLLAKR